MPPQADQVTTVTNKRVAMERFHPDRANIVLRHSQKYFVEHYVLDFREHCVDASTQNCYISVNDDYCCNDCVIVILVLTSGCKYNILKESSDDSL